MPQFSAKETALIAEANAKAKARGAITTRKPALVNGAALASKVITDAELAKTGAAIVAKHGKAVKTPAVHVVPTAPAHNAAEKAPHTKRAIAQNKVQVKITDAEAKLAEAKATMDAATKLATASKKADPDRAAKFAAKAQAELDLLTARKALQALRREAETPEERAARGTKVTAKKTPAPKAARQYKVISTEHGARPDSKRAKQLAIVFKYTDTAKAKEAGAESVDFAFAEVKGFIKYL